MSNAKDLKFWEISFEHLKLFYVRFGIYYFDVLIVDLKIYINEIGLIKVHPYIVFIIVFQKRQDIRRRQFCPITQKIAPLIYVFKIAICHNSLHKIVLQKRRQLSHINYYMVQYSVFNGYICT